MPRSAATKALRATTAILGGYLFTYGFVAFATLVAFALGLRFFEAQALSNMVAFLVFLGALLWGFAAQRTAWLLLVLVGGGLAMSVVAWVLSRTFL